jgi:hypothetical protein
MVSFLFFINQATVSRGAPRLHTVASVGRISPKSAKLMAFSPGGTGFLSEATPIAG